MKGFIIAAIMVCSSQIANAKEIVLTTNNVCVIDKDVDGASMATAKLCLADKIATRRGRKYPIYLYINSGGGSVYAGLQFIQFAKTLNNVHTVSNFAASMAAAIVEHLPGKRYITEMGIMMFHRARGGVKGQFEDGELESRLKLWKTIVRKSEKIQSKRIGITLKEYKKRIVNEWWLVGDEAVEQNVVDEMAVVKCSAKLSKQFIEENVRTIFGSYKAKKSKCPLLN